MRVTGVIYVIIIALWAAVLIPMWLRRHDQISEVRSTARFSDAMRSLGRADDPTSSVRSAPSAAQRRTTVLIVLSAGVATAFGAALAGIAPRWLPIITAVILAAYLVAAALTAPQRSSARETRTSQRATRDSTPDVKAAASRGTAVEVEAEVDDWETWNAWDDDDESWAPVPATVPTYVTAPRATAIPRPIDRTASGEWTGSAMVDAAQRMRTAEQEAADRQAAEIEAALVDARSQTAEIPVVGPAADTRRAAGA